MPRFKNEPAEPAAHKKLEVIRKVAVVCCSVLAAFVIFLLYRNYVESENMKRQQQARDYYNELVEKYANMTPAETAVPTVSPRENETDVAPEPSPAPKVLKAEFAEFIKYYGNEDIVGYLKIDGTTIDYPIVQAEDNDYYLNHDIYKKKQ